MTTATLPHPRAVPASEAAAVNARPMYDALNRGATGNSIGARLAALPRKAAATLRAALHAFKLDAVANGFAAAWARLLPFASGLLGRLASVGFGTIFGVVLTAGRYRRTAVTFVSKAYRLVTAPLRGLAWLLRRCGLAAPVNWISRQVSKVEAYVGAQVEKGLTWLDRNEYSGAMRWGRTIFQATFIQRALRIVFPWASGSWVFFASLFVPTFGLKHLPTTESPAEEAAIKRAADKLRVAGEAAAAVPSAKVTDITSAVRKADEMKAKIEQPVVIEGEVVEAEMESVEEYVCKIATGDLFEVRKGQVVIDGKTYPADALPEGYEIGKVIVKAEGEEADKIQAAIEEAKRTEAALKAAAAPATGSRENRRAAQSGKKK